MYIRCTADSRHGKKPTARSSRSDPQLLHPGSDGGENRLSEIDRAFRPFGTERLARSPFIEPIRIARRDVHEVELASGAYERVESGNTWLE